MSASGEHEHEPDAAQRSQPLPDGSERTTARPDPTSSGALSRFATAAHGRVFGENDLPALAQTIRAEAGHSPVSTSIIGYARVALAPWFVLAGVVPLGFLLYRRNW